VVAPVGFNDRFQKKPALYNPSGSGDFGDGVAGMKYGAIVPLSFSGEVLALPAVTTGHGKNDTVRRLKSKIETKPNIFIA
jgi:hypothetical protein